MKLRFVRPSIPHALLWAFVCLSEAATGLGLRSTLVPLLMAPSIVALFATAAFAPGVIVWATRLARIGAAFAWLGAFVITLLPVAPTDGILRSAVVLAPLLIVVAGVLLLARSVPGRGLLPAVFGAVVAASLHPEPRYFRIVLGSAFAAFVLWLATHDDERGVPVKLRPARLFFFILVSSALAVGTVLFLPWAQPQVEAMAAKMIAQELGGGAGLAMESHLGDIEELSTSKRVAARFYSDRPANLRARTFSRFDGRSWKGDQDKPLRLGAFEVPRGRFRLFDETSGTAFSVSPPQLDGVLHDARLIVTAPQRGAMPSPANTVAVKIEDLDVDRSPSGILFASGTASFYGMLFREESREGETSGRDALQLPEDLDPRIRELAVRIGNGATSPMERAARVQAYLQSGFRYSLNVGKFRSQDPIAEFLFEKKKGYCEYFATASTILLRLNGVPARYVTGYAVRPFQREDDSYVIRDEDAHAWSEAFIEERGWIEVDATPPGDYEAVHGDVNSGGVLSPLFRFVDQMRARFAQSGVPGVLRWARDGAMDHARAIAGLGLALLIFKHRARLFSRLAANRATRRAGLSAALRPETRRVLEAVDSLCASRGAARPVTRSPLEHVKDPRIRLTDDEREICVRSVGAVFDERYGGIERESRELEGLLESLEP